MNHPDPRKHKHISFSKSAIRIAGFCVLPWNVMLAAILLLIAEGLGVYEEMV